MIDIKITQKRLIITWQDGEQSSFNYIWLREAYQNSNRQRKGSLLDIPQNIAIQSAVVNDKEQLEITWNNQKETSLFDLDWLRQNCYANQKKNNRWQPKLWDASSMTTLPVADYNAIITDKKVLRDWLGMFRDYGFGLLKNVPKERGVIVKLANSLSYVNPYIWQQEIYDVEKKINPKYIADTNVALNPHTDGSYVYATPTAQILHCLENTVEGGESTLVDGFKIATVLREQHPEKFELLTNWNIRHAYQYRSKEKNLDYEVEAPLIRLDSQGNLEQIRFAYHSLQPFEFPLEIMEAYYDAFYVFNKMIVDASYQLEFKLMPGDLYMIDNYRMLHGRKSFSATAGHRHLQTCYLGRDGLWGHLRV